ncbi:MAG: hypothetical protein ACJASQ_002938 [Crocinitomicaceae bacterium]|jgi:hypothetical protein
MELHRSGTKLGNGGGLSHVQLGGKHVELVWGDNCFPTTPNLIFLRNGSKVSS